MISWFQCVLCYYRQILLFPITLAIVPGNGHCFLISYLHHSMVAPKFSIANTISDNSNINPYINQPNIERPSDTTVNIQRGCMPSRNSYRIPCSLSFSPMDSFPPSKVDYAKRIATLSNKMDIKMANSTTNYSSAPMAQCPHVYNEVVLMGDF